MRLRDRVFAVVGVIGIVALPVLLARATVNDWEPERWQEPATTALTTRGKASLRPPEGKFYYKFGVRPWAYKRESGQKTPPRITRITRIQSAKSA